MDALSKMNLEKMKQKFIDSVEYFVGDIEKDDIREHTGRYELYYYCTVSHMLDAQSNTMERICNDFLKEYKNTSCEKVNEDNINLYFDEYKLGMQFDTDAIFFFIEYR